MPATMKDVFSSDIKSIGFDFDKSALIVVWLRTGRVSMYSDVPAKIAEDVINSWSVGSAVRTEIKPFYKHMYIKAVDADEGEEKE